MPADPKLRRESHPIRLVRNKCNRPGLPDGSTAASFAREIGYSDSLIRNTESGIIKMSKNLAGRIASETGVSAEWLEEAAAKWRQGEDITNEPILDTEGQAWPPTVTESLAPSTTMATRLRISSVAPDELGNLTEILYRFFPDYLPDFMGAVMKSILIVNAPPSKDSRLAAADRNLMKKYIDWHILPVIKMVDALGERHREQFYEALTLHLGRNDASGSNKLLEWWEVMDPRSRSNTSRGEPPLVDMSEPSEPD